jgi:putative restriction endonuclease
MAELIFGEVPEVPVGTIFPNRMALYRAGVHRSIEGGISGRQEEGANSIVISGGYEDDEDNGSIIIYTGHGGRDAKTRKQIANQKLTRQNLALARSRTLDLPVRVIRKTSAGFRYDGLYSVEDVWQEKGKSRFTVYRFKLVAQKILKGALEATDLSAKIPTRRTITISRIVRDSEASRRVKQWYDFKCQVCSVVLSVPGGFYAEGAHVKPLGVPHEGSDSIDNILCLCPNHHALFDYGAFSVSDDLTLIGLKGKLFLRKDHHIDLSNFHYHREHILQVLGIENRIWARHADRTI